MPKIISNYIELHIFNSAEGKFLLLKRAIHKIYPGIWQMVTACVEENETTKDTLLRELFEETKLKPIRLFIIPHINSFYLEENDSVNLCPVFLAIVESVNVIISDEHTEYRWVGFDEAVKLIHWPNQIESLEVIQKYLTDKNLFDKLDEIKI
ncbi:MAG: NUDIX hydrolase [Ignavibacteria bacterium]